MILKERASLNIIKNLLRDKNRKRRDEKKLRKKKNA